MFSYLKKRKEAILFLLIFVLSLFLIQFYRENQFTDAFIGKVVFFFATPSQNFSSYLKKNTTSLIKRQFFLKRLEKENASLKRELEKEKLKNIEAQKLRIAYGNLRKAFVFNEKNNDQLILGDIIGDITNGYSKILVINRGSKDGILKNQSVIHSLGLVGKTIQVNKNESYVQLITDKKSSIPVMLQRTRDRGILYGQGNNKLTLRFISLDSNIKKGDIIVTSGLSGIHTKDFPIGKVKSFQENVFFYSIEAVIEPFINFSRLEFIFVTLQSSNNDSIPLFQQ